MDRCRHGALDSLVILKVFHVKAVHESSCQRTLLVLKLSMFAKIRFKSKATPFCDSHNIFY